jgi:hypothetical protein
LPYEIERMLAELDEREAASLQTRNRLSDNLVVTVAGAMEQEPFRRAA